IVNPLIIVFSISADISSGIVGIECHYVTELTTDVRKERIMIANVLWPRLALIVLFVSPASVAHAAASSPDTPQLLAGDRVLLGTVEDIRSDQARINTGEVEPRFVPMDVRKGKGLPALKP